MTVIRVIWTEDRLPDRWSLLLYRNSPVATLDVTIRRTRLSRTESISLHCIVICIYTCAIIERPRRLCDWSEFEVEKMSQSIFPCNNPTGRRALITYIVTVQCGRISEWMANSFLLVQTNFSSRDNRGTRNRWTGWKTNETKRRCSSFLFFFSSDVAAVTKQRTRYTPVVYGKYRETSGQKCDRHAREVKRTPTFSFQNAAGSSMIYRDPFVYRKSNVSKRPFSGHWNFARVKRLRHRCVEDLSRALPGNNNTHSDGLSSTHISHRLLSFFRFCLFLPPSLFFSLCFHHLIFNVVFYRFYCAKIQYTSDPGHLYENVSACETCDRQKNVLFRFIRKSIVSVQALKSGRFRKSYYKRLFVKIRVKN